MKLTNSWLYDIQAALEDGNRKCKTMKEKFAKQQAEIIKLHKLELLKKEDSLKKQLSEQEEEFQKKLFLQRNKLKMQLIKREKILKEVVSEREKLTGNCMNLEKKVEKLDTDFQCLQAENNQLQVSCSVEQLHDGEPPAIGSVNLEIKCFKWISPWI